MTLFGYATMRPAGRTARPLLYLAAGFNFVAAGLVVLLARIAPGVLGVTSFDAGAMLFVDLSALLVVGYGIGYALAGRDLRRFWPCIALGVLGKLGVVVLVFACFVAGRTTPLVTLLACGDAIFAAAFVGLLRRHGAT